MGMTGAGLSSWAEYPLWQVALRRLANLITELTGNPRIGSEILNRNTTDMLFCAKRLGKEIGEMEFRKFISREFGPNGRIPDDVLLRFSSLPLSHIFTLNFDPSCETAHAILGLPCRSLSSASDTDLVTFFREIDNPHCTKTVFHLHGRYDDPLNQIALSEDGYRRLYSPGSLFHHQFLNLAISKSLLFAGLSFTDKDVERIFSDCARLVQAQVGDGTIHHFAIIGLGDSDRPEDSDEARRQLMSDRYLADTIFYDVHAGENPHRDFGALITELSEALNLSAPVIVEPEAATQSTVEPDDIQRMDVLSDAFLRRIDRGQNDV